MRQQIWVIAALTSFGMGGLLPRSAEALHRSGQRRVRLRGFAYRRKARRKRMDTFVMGCGNGDDAIFGRDVDAAVCQAQQERIVDSRARRSGSDFVEL
jgi:hypothetical protein